MLLSDSNYRLFAARYYRNPSCVGENEFQEDLNTLFRLNHSFDRFTKCSGKNERLILNQVISFTNVFEHKAAIELMFYKISPRNHSMLKTVLIVLRKIRSDDIRFHKITLDSGLLRCLLSALDVDWGNLHMKRFKDYLEETEAAGTVQSNVPTADIIPKKDKKPKVSKRYK